MQSSWSEERRRNSRSPEWQSIEADDRNMLVRLEWPTLEEEFYMYLQGQYPEIEGIVAFHLHIEKEGMCHIAPKSEWMRGDFNVCIPISVPSHRKQRFLLRCPFPHKFNGSLGLAEKISCEAANYAWISQNCPRVPIPHLWGFGLPRCRSFTRAVNTGWTYIDPFIPRERMCILGLKSGYLLIDLIEEEQGTLAIKTWPPPSEEKRRNLYKSMSNIMLDLASHPLDKIGSFVVTNRGALSLSNRPLTAHLPLLEIDRVPTDIDEQQCYSTTSAYLNDLVHCLDQRLTHQPNAVRNADDAEGQMAALATLRAMVPPLAQRHLDKGPFVFCWTDKSLGNFFVDADYNITAIFDLDWCCSHPIETEHPPFWISGWPVPEISRAHDAAYRVECEKFMAIFQQEDHRRQSALGPGVFTRIMRSGISSNTHWFMASLREPRGACNMFLERLQPRFAPQQYSAEGEATVELQKSMAQYWTVDPKAFIDKKLRERHAYLNRLRYTYQYQKPSVGYHWPPLPVLLSIFTNLGRQETVK